MIVLYGITGILLALSFALNRTRTVKALRLAAEKFLKIVPAFLVITALTAVSLYFIPAEKAARFLGGDNLPAGVISASVLGSISFIPGFIVFPLTGLLRQHGTSLTVLSAFTTTLMMVGIITIPLEKEYLGMKLTIARNAAGFVTALAVAAVTGLVFGELHLW
ncbi:MAG: hypothetical protein JXB03_01515 [Spirochaetales bacterium]|nr:hypothetical protein [Spirochaetales bacterium]